MGSGWISKGLQRTPVKTIHFNSLINSHFHSHSPTDTHFHSPHTPSHLLTPAHNHTHLLTLTLTPTLTPLPVLCWVLLWGRGGCNSRSSYDRPATTPENMQDIAVYNNWHGLRQCPFCLSACTRTHTYTYVQHTTQAFMHPRTRTHTNAQMKEYIQ